MPYHAAIIILTTRHTESKTILARKKLYYSLSEVEVVQNCDLITIFPG